jgi:hypothetical protein
MGSVIGDIIPLAIGIALSPMGIVAVILMLLTKKARSTSLGFLIGWFLGIAVVATVVVFIADPTQQATGGKASPLSVIVNIVLGLLLLIASYRNWQKRAKPGEEAEMPKWMSSIDSFTAGKALGMGALLSGVNPKNLALVVGAGFAIAAAGLDSTQTIIGLIVFVILACISVAAPVIVYLVMGDKASFTLNSWKTWLMHNNATVMMIVLLLFGVKLLGKGLGALIGG